MTKEQALLIQLDIESKGFDLSHWYGTNCIKCCGVYPKFKSVLYKFEDLCRFECPVCGKTTDLCSMAWEAEELWNETFS